MRKIPACVAGIGIALTLAAAAPALAQTLLAAATMRTGPAQAPARRVVADLWLRQIVNDQNLDGDHTTYYVSIYRKQGAQGEEHRIVGPRPVGEWRWANNTAVGPNIADRLIRANFRGDTRYVIRLTHGDGTVALPNDPSVEFALDAGNHVIAMAPEAMQCSATPGRQPGIYLKAPTHTWLWITVETPGLTEPQIATC